MSQSSTILGMLQRGERVTALSVFRRCGCLTLHSRASELRARGHKIGCIVMAKGRSRVGVYYLVK